MARRVRTIALLMLLLAALALVAVGGIRLDQRFADGRFTTAGYSDGCPIAVWRDVAIPMCVPLYPGW